MEMIETGKTGPKREAEAGAVKDDDAPQPLEAMGIEMAFDSAVLDREGFVAAVRQAADGLGSEFLFDLPASGLSEDCRQLAVLRHERENEADLLLVVRLGEDGETISVAEPDEAMTGLAEFARAFVNLLSRL